MEILICIKARLYCGQRRGEEILFPMVFLELGEFCKSEKDVPPEGNKEQEPGCSEVNLVDCQSRWKSFSLHQGEVPL